MLGICGLVLLLATSGAAADVISTRGTVDHIPAAAPGFGLLHWSALAAALLALAAALRRRAHRLDAVPPRPHGFSPPVAVALAAAMLLLGTLGIQTARTLGGAAGAEGPVDPASLGHADLAAMAVGRYAAQALVVIAVLVHDRRAAAPAGAPGPARGHGALGAAAVGALALLVLWPLLQGVSAAGGWVHGRVTGVLPEAVAHETLRVVVEAPRDAWLAVLVITLVIGPALAEEVMYRGLLQRALGEATLLPRWWAIVATSLLFTLMHVGAAEPHVLPTLLLFSVGLGWAYERTGRLLAPIVMHGLFNLGNLAIALLAA